MSWLHLTCMSWFVRCCERVWPNNLRLHSVKRKLRKRSGPDCADIPRSSCPKSSLVTPKNCSATDTEQCEVKVKWWWWMESLKSEIKRSQVCGHNSQVITQSPEELRANHTRQRERNFLARELLQEFTGITRLFFFQHQLLFTSSALPLPPTPLKRHPSLQWDREGGTAVIERPGHGRQQCSACQKQPHGYITLDVDEYLRKLKTNPQIDLHMTSS